MSESVWAIWIPALLATPVWSAVTLLSRQLWKNAEKSRTKGEYGREVDSRASSQLLDSPRETPAPANYHKVTLGAVNRRVASSNLARGAKSFHSRRALCNASAILAIKTCRDGFNALSRLLR